MKIPITKQKFKRIFFISTTLIFILISLILFQKDKFDLKFNGVIEEDFNENIRESVASLKELITKPSPLNSIRDIIRVPFELNSYNFCIINKGYIRDVKNERIIIPEINVTFGEKNYLVKSDTKKCETIEIGKEDQWDIKFTEYYIKFPGLVQLSETTEGLDFSHYRLSFFVEAEKNELWGKRILTIISLYGLLWLISRLAYLFFNFDIWKDFKFTK
jgi:hypothetical protein